MQIKQYKMFESVLIINRGEIALRILRTLKSIGIKSYSVFSEQDKDSYHLELSDYIYPLKGNSAKETYLNQDQLIDIINKTQCEAVHPGYGFLSENHEFAKRVQQETKAKFIGPTPETIKLLGSKIDSRNLMIANNIPVLPGSSSPIKSITELKQLAQNIGYPLMLKASYGGGGRGIRVVSNPSELIKSYEECKREAKNYFGNDEVFCEKYIKNPRHIEIQILCDQHNNAIHLLERECSIQRKHQKLIEEAPSCLLNQQDRNYLGELAIKIASASKYEGVGTCEFIYEKPKHIYFMEMNTRIQVEHPVTEMITGVDLIKEQILCAAGYPLKIQQNDISPKGWAVEARINAECPEKDFLPTSGTIENLSLLSPPNVRIDTHLYINYSPPSEYDSLLAKVIAWGASRQDAIDRLKQALDEIKIEGLITNISFLKKILSHKLFSAGNYTTAFIKNNLDELTKDHCPQENLLHSIDAIHASLLASCQTSSKQLTKSTPDANTHDTSRENWHKEAKRLPNI
jgi:acetyl-CoA carboxylase, biotin carboxylase subunit